MPCLLSPLSGGDRRGRRHAAATDGDAGTQRPPERIFSGLQYAHKESRSAEAAVLEDQVHHMLREWRAELSVASPASSLQNSQGNTQRAADPSSETLRLLQKEDDTTSRPSVADASTAISSQPRAWAGSSESQPRVVVSWGHGMLGDCGG